MDSESGLLRYSGTLVGSVWLVFTENMLTYANQAHIISKGEDGGTPD